MVQAMDGALRDGNPPRDLRWREPDDVTEDHDLALALGESVEGGQEVARTLRTRLLRLPCRPDVLAGNAPLRA